MASYIEINDLGSFANIEALWAAHPEGGHEGDYCTIDGVKYHWDKYDRMWVAPPNFGPTRPRQVTTFNGDVNIQNNLTVAGTIRAKGINNPCVGFFPSEEALEEKWPYPKVGWWAIVGDTIPGEIYHCVTEGEWTDSEHTGGSGEVDLTEYAKLTDIPEIADDLVTNDSNKVLSARQGKILNEKIPPVVDNLTSTSATSSLSAKQGKVLNEKIPTVIDNLTTSSPISALSAKQGKILKTLIDNIGSINVEGIQGFWPIDSLDDLPENPTEEQKKLAYLYENALYIYVGAGGDTLDGKYKSTQLVTLDWNDKAYAPSIYNGLGRTTLKKNMVEGVNVLTSAMISTDNTEYFIQYDYDLDGAEVTLPANASLVFMGGSIKNGTLIGNNTRIQAKKGVCIFDGITIQGTWDVTEAYSSWFKMHKKGYKIKSVTENGTTIGSTSYATFRVEGYNADSTIDYVAAPSSVTGTFDASGYAQYDDTASLQNLFDLRAKKTVVEDGIYIIDALRNNPESNKYIGLFYDKQKDSELVINGWIKVLPNNKTTYYALSVVDCDCIRVHGKGGIQGDLLDHTGANPNPPTFYSEWGMNIAVATTRNLLMEDLTSEYAWGDCIYCHWWDYGRGGQTYDNSFQSNHTLRNLSLRYGGRSGLVYERGNNVVVDGCSFYGTGRVRGKETNSAIDIEPPNQAEVPVRYVMNYEFKNNVFENSANGLRLERCVNCSVHDNYFDYGWSGVLVIWHKDVSYDITSPDDRGWIKSSMKIYNNTIRRCTQGVYVSSSDPNSSRKYSENIDIYENTFVSCSSVFVSDNTMKATRIYNNNAYGCGQWLFTAMEDCEIYNNSAYGCKMPVLTSTWGSGNLLRFSNFNGCKNSSFHDNHFSLDYGKPIYGLGENGKVEYYHGLPIGYKYPLCDGADLTKPGNVSIYDNYISDDFTLLYSDSYNYQGNLSFEGNLCSIRNEQNEVFLKGDKFRSNTYGDEGIVTRGGMTSCSWLKTEAEGGIVREFEPNMEVAYGEIIKVGDNYKVCRVAGSCGETYDSGTAAFLSSNDANGYVPNASVSNRIRIVFKTRGVCTSGTRPDSFLYAGRKMWETDTNREIVYDGTDWVYNDIYTEE